MHTLVRRYAAISRLGLVVFLALQLAACSSAEQRAQKYYENGMKLLAASSNEKAAIEFRNALSLKHDFLPAWRGLAQADRATRQWDGLLTDLQSILQLDSSDTAGRVELARLLLAGGAIDQALKIINESTADAATPDILALKAAIFFKLKDYSNAVRAAQAAIKGDPRNADALKVLAAERLVNSDARAALELLSSSAVSDSPDIGIQLLKMKAFEELGQVAEVERLLKSLVAQQPEQSGLHRQLIKFYVDHGRPTDAEQELRGITATDPKNSDAELDLIRLLYTIKGPPAARAELVTRINSGGDVFVYQLALAEFDFLQGNVDASFDLLKSLAADKSSNDHALTAKLKLAELNIAKNNLTAAEGLIAEVLHDDSLNALKLHPNALKLRARISINRGQFEAAIFDLRQALQSQPRSAELLVLLATAYERSGTIELAEKQFTEALRVSDADPAVALNYVGFLQRRGNTQRADDIMTEVATRHPENLQVMAALAQIKLARQDWTAAQEISAAIRRTGSYNGAADEILGEALAGQRKYEESITAFQDAIGAAPTAIQPMVSLVRALVRSKQVDRAEAFLRSVLKSNPTNAQAYVLLGSIELAKNAPDQAMRSFMAAIERQPKDSIGYRAVADLYLSQKNGVAALMIIRAGLKQQPDSVPLHLALAAILEQTGNYDGAIAEYEALVSLDPGSMIVVNNLASLLADHRTDKASLERAQSLASGLRQSQVPQFKDTLGWVSYRRGDYNAALPLLSEAAATLPDVVLIRYHLGMVYAAMGKNNKASAELKAALTKAPDSALQARIETELAKVVTQ